MKSFMKTFEKWKRWCKDIENDLTDLLKDKQIHDFFFEMVNENLEHLKAIDGTLLFFDFVRNCYADRASVGVRRYIKPKDKKSLMRLLKEMKKYAEQFTYDFYLSCYPIEDGQFEWQKPTFNIFSDDGKVVSKRKIEEDIKSLKNTCDKVEKFVDKGIAHLDKSGSPKDITFNDLANSLDIVNKMACKYLTLITSAGNISLTPAIQFNWEKIFTVPFDIREESQTISGA